VPPFAGNFSAWGLLGADLAQSLARTQVALLNEDSIRTANAILEMLFSEILARSTVAGNREPVEHEAALDMRYLGQEHSITVPVPYEDGRIVWGVDAVRSAFVEHYEKTFASTLDAEAQLVAVRATSRRRLARQETEVHATSSTDGEPQPRQIRAYS